MSKGTQPKRRPRGRPALPAEEVKRHPVGFRTTAALKDQLEKAAKASGRSVAQEVEFRLEGSFRNEALLGEAMTLTFGRWLAGLLALLGKTMRHAGTEMARRELDQHKDIRAGISELENWHRHPPAFNQARLAAISLLEALVRPGDPVPEGAPPTIDDPVFAFDYYAPGWAWGQDFMTLTKIQK